MSISTKPSWNDTPAARPMPDPGKGRRARRRSAARRARDRTMGRLAVPHVGLAPHVPEPYAGWDEPPLPLLLDGDFDHDVDDLAMALAGRLHRAVRDEEDDWG
ncbi:hypothetical protein WYO_0090 [Methylobacterium sp. GXF4]|jgi:hypothetical protein|uniref:hypothetical protein n=1 Tax=Methylobacterium sp. GXF4 TaxID=1096546 RepID=UPI00026985CE|nr:hypothetical protein [Methylobacterium sp. GXF4]EIZ87226.1 hypothetical protein WYO_0090 [Methylobacterium sp. GXF4]